MKKIKIEVGKKYVRADGEVVKCDRICGGVMPYYIGGLWYKKNLSTPGCDDYIYKIISEYQEPKTYTKEQTSVIQHKFLIDFAKRQKKPFSIDFARARWIALVDDKDYPVPHHNSWGAVWNNVRKTLEENGYLVTLSNYNTAKIPSAHGRLVREWCVKKVAK